jgi:hypothetical protein
VDVYSRHMLIGTSRPFAVSAIRSLLHKALCDEKAASFWLTPTTFAIFSTAASTKRILGTGSEAAPPAFCSDEFSSMTGGSSNGISPEKIRSSSDVGTTSSLYPSL